MAEWDIPEWAVEKAKTSARVAARKFEHPGCTVDDLEQEAMIFLAERPDVIERNEDNPDYIGLVTYRFLVQKVKPYASRYVSVTSYSYDLAAYLGQEDVRDDL